MHDALAFASLIFGESSTMSEEATILGTPAVYLNNNNIIYTQELEHKYSLMYNYTESLIDQDKSIQKVIELLQNDKLKEEWRIKADRLLEEKIDVTAFLVWFVEKYPESKKIMIENPEYQYRFR
jgi:uncharacterized protein